MLVGLGAALVFLRRQTVAEEVQAFRDSLTPAPVDPLGPTAPSERPVAVAGTDRSVGTESLGARGNITAVADVPPSIGST